MEWILLALSIFGIICSSIMISRMIDKRREEECPDDGVFTEYDDEEDHGAPK